MWVFNELSKSRQWPEILGHDGIKTLWSHNIPGGGKELWGLAEASVTVSNRAKQKRARGQPHHKICAASYYSWGIIIELCVRKKRKMLILMCTHGL